jgi:N-acetylglucosaminyl-diphospho-decaprenol L-rhamnosyltransferase
MKSNVTVILTLYKTPASKIKNLNQYKNYKTIFFEQKSNGSFKKELSSILKYKFKYYYSSKNIGLSKSSNFLLSKVKTKYCLFTQPDIKISSSSIKTLIKAMNKDIIFASPKYVKKIDSFQKRSPNKIKKKINMACVLMNVNKIKKIRFFDEDFFLYWEDIFLMKKINKTHYKMIEVNNAFAAHESSKSSEDNYKTRYIRDLNFIYGEFLYDYKVGKLRFIKIFRKLIQNIILFFFNILIFQLKRTYKNIANICGITKFVKFYLMSFKIF